MTENMKTIIEQMFKLFFRLNFVIPTEMLGIIWTNVQKILMRAEGIFNQMIKKMLVATIAALIFCANFSCRTLTSEDYYNRGIAYALQKMPTLACNDLYKAGILFLKINDRNNLLKCINNMKQADPSSPLIKKLMDTINANPEKK